MSAKESKTSVSLPRLTSVSGLSGVAVYFVTGDTQYTYLVLGMMGILMLMGAFKKIGRGTAMWSIGFMAVCVLAAGLMPSFALAEFVAVPKLIPFIVFCFIGIGALGALLKVLFGLGGVFLLLFVFVYIQSNRGQQVSEEGAVQETPLVEEKDERLVDEAHPNDVLISHLRDWKDYRSVEYARRLEVWESQVGESEQYQKRLRVPRSYDTHKYWQKIYKDLSNYDSEALIRIISVFHTLAEEKRLNKEQFANVIVSCVQDIPYVFIKRTGCEEVRKSNPNAPCKPNVAFGLQSPSQFMEDLKGDCDTRTVFLYTVMDKLGYKVAILNSDTYGHSMLGVEMSAIGKYKSYRGRRYYFWETTAMGWKAGVIPPEMGEPKDWYVVLAN